MAIPELHFDGSIAAARERPKESAIASPIASQGAVTVITIAMTIVQAGLLTAFIPLIKNIIPTLIMFGALGSQGPFQQCGFDRQTRTERQGHTRTSGSLSTQSIENEQNRR